MGHRLNVCMLPFPLRRGNVIACKYTYFTLNGNCRRPFFYASAVKDGANGRECGLPPIPRRSRPTAKVAAIAPARPCHGGVARSLPAKKRLRRRPNALPAELLPPAFKSITLPPTRQTRWENNLKRQPYVTQQERHDALPRPRPLLQPWLAAQVLHRRPRGGVLAHPARQHRLGHGHKPQARCPTAPRPWIAARDGASRRSDGMDWRRGAAVVPAVPRGQPRQGPQRPWVGDRMKQAAHRCAQPVSRYAPTRGRSLRQPSPPSWRV